MSKSANSSNSAGGRWLESSKPYVATLAIIALCTLLGWGVSLLGLTSANVVMVFLAGVALVAARFGHGPSVVAAVLSVFIFDYFFVPPILSLVPTEAEYFVDLAVMLGVGLLISELTARLQTQLRTTQRQEKTSSQLYQISRQLNESDEMDFLIQTAGQQLAEIFSGNVAIFLINKKGHLERPFDQDTELFNQQTSLAAAAWAAEQNAFSGMATDHFADAQALFVPMIGTSKTLGVLGIRPAESVKLNDTEQRRLLATCANLVALSIERAQSSLAVQDAQMQVETERFRNHVLSSVSHDLRSPLATITTMAASILEESTEKSWPAQQERLQIVVNEAQRLSRQVENLLRYARMTSGPITLDRQWHAADELVEVVLTRLQTELADRDVKVHIDDDVPMLWIEGNLMEQVFMNLLENAIHYTPSDSQIIISACRSADQIELSVADNGPGFPAGYETKLFEKFFRPPRSAQGRRGIGLGLAICKAIVNAHEGQIRAANRTGSGAQFTIALPCPPHNPDDMLEEGDLEESDLLENQPPC